MRNDLETIQAELKTLQEARKRAVKAYRKEREERPASHSSFWAEKALEKAESYLNANGIDSHGVEGFAYNQYEGFQYVNRGETYTGTILFDGVRERFLVCSWGDYVEEMEKQGYSTEQV